MAINKTKRKIVGGIPDDTFIVAKYVSNVAFDHWDSEHPQLESEVLRSFRTSSEGNELGAKGARFHCLLPLAVP
jgi:hypothetical protein